MPRKKTRPLCAVEGCTRQADYEVFLYDVYYETIGSIGSMLGVAEAAAHEDRPFYVFMEQDITCPNLCQVHWMENEAGCSVSEGYKEEDMARIRDEHGFVRLSDLNDLPEPARVLAPRSREYRGVYHYPYTNRHRAHGFSIYRPLGDEAQPG